MRKLQFIHRMIEVSQRVITSLSPVEEELLEQPAMSQEHLSA